MNLAVQTDRPTRRGALSIAITSGKGGVGKTNVAVNLAAALRRKGQRVAVIDADFALGNVDVLLGLTPTWHLGHLLGGDKTLPDVLVTLPTGVKVIPSGSGARELTTLTSRQLSRLMGLIDEVAASHDYLLIDTAAGMSDNVLDVLVLAERILVVVAPEPTAIVDAYALIKVVTLSDRAKDVGILVNDAEDAEQAVNVFRQLDVAATHFLQRRLRYYGWIPHDEAVHDAVIAQRPVVEHRPQAEASMCFQRLATRFTNPPAPAAGVLMFPPRSSRPPAMADAGLSERRESPGTHGATGEEGPLCA